MLHTDLLTVATIFCIYMHQVGSDEINVDLCLDHGFSSRLSCGSCKELAQFHLEQLSATCEQCCHDDIDVNNTKTVYPFALFIVCECKFGRYPQIEAFVKSDRPKQFRGLEIRYAQGAEPIIKLLNENREVQETLNIKKWNTDTIEEFLKERLKH